jgi:hypothetical protein
LAAAASPSAGNLQRAQAQERLPGGGRVQKWCSVRWLPGRFNLRELPNYTPLPEVEGRFCPVLSGTFRQIPPQRAQQARTRQLARQLLGQACVDTGLNVQKTRRTRAFPWHTAILLLTVALVCTQWDFQLGAHFWTAIVILTVALFGTAAGRKRRKVYRPPAPCPLQAQPVKHTAWNRGSWFAWRHYETVPKSPH